MPDSIQVMLFLILASLYASAWAWALRHGAERSRRIRVWSMYLMGKFRLTQPQAQSLLLTAVYYLPGILGSLVFAGIYRLPLGELFSWQWSFIPITILGIIAEISLANLLVGFYVGYTRINPFPEVQNIPWIGGLAVFPTGVMMGLLVASAFIEELFFRGVVLLILVNQLQITPFWALAFVTALFIIEQALQLKTAVQKAIISCSCLSISLIGCLLVLGTGSIVPAALSHMSFVVFFFGYSQINPAQAPLPADPPGLI